MSTVSEPMAARPRPGPRLMLPPTPPPAPSAGGKYWFRLSWLLGLALLTASLVGASHVLQSRQTEPPPQAKPSAERPVANSLGVYCLGNVAIDGVLPDGVPLAPMQQGQVTEVLVYEGQTVHKGDILLRVDDEAAQLTVALAEKGVRIAQAKLDEARQGPERYRHALDAQQAAVDSAKAQVASAEFTVRRLEALKEMTNANELAAAHEKVNALKAAVTAEEAQLRALQADRPEPKVQQAEGNLALAQEQVNAARLQLKKCVLEAPDNGTILRINSAKGSLITSQTRLPPIQFAPAGPRVIRAEVPQEFAHRIQVGMPALIHDVAIPDFSWQGTVKNLAPAYLPKRSAGTEMLSLSGNDAWVLECIVELAPTATPPRLNQRVRVGIGTQRTP